MSNSLNWIHQGMAFLSDIGQQTTQSCSHERKLGKNKSQQSGPSGERVQDHPVHASCPKKFMPSADNVVPVSMTDLVQEVHRQD